MSDWLNDIGSSSEKVEKIRITARTFFFFKKVTFVIDRSFFISYCLIVRYSYVMLRTRTRQSVSFGFKNNT